MERFELHLKPISRFLKDKVNSGALLLVATVAAMLLANSPAADFYFALFEETTISFDFSFLSLSEPLYYWVNEFLMAIFFLMIGLEVKRELLLGELSTRQKALSPMVAALGGMVVPAAIFMIINWNNPSHVNGWAIPMATDIAFALSVMTFLKGRVPVELKIFLVSLAIVDDIGAVLTIALYYTNDISVFYLTSAGIGFLTLMLLNFLRLRSLWVYLVVGFFLVWYPLLESGVHATIAGVLVAFTIPIHRKFNANQFIKRAQSSLHQFRESSSFEKSDKLLGADQYDSISDLNEYIKDVSPPLQRLEHNLQGFTLYFIMPLFAFANTGIRLEDFNYEVLFQNTLPLGILFGLLLGKVLGITLFTYIFQRLGIITLSEKFTWRHIIGAGFLAGIGFTMSIFITDLAFHGDKLVTISKVAILSASLIAGVVGYLILAGSSSNKADEPKIQ